MDEKVLSRMQRLCISREYCRSDMRAKVLKALDGNEEAADEMMEALVRDRFVDDLRYASAFARDKSSLAGWGTVKIRYALSRKGIERSVIQDALAEIDSGKADSKMKSVIEAKYRSISGAPDAKIKLLRYALGRGYAYDEVREVVDNLIRLSEDGRY